MDRKAFSPLEIKLSVEGDIELAFSQLNVIDGDGDVTLPGAFAVKDVPLSAYGHTSWDGQLPVGKGTISESKGWGVFKGQFFMDTTAGRDTYNTIKALGPLAEYSYGFNTLDYSFGQQDGKAVRFLKSLDVFEVSPVLKGAGIGTHTLAIKSGRPASDTPYAELLSWYADGLPDLLDRVKDRAAFRAKEGRALSSANRQMLSDLASALETHLASVHDLLTSTAPAPETIDVTAEVLAMEAERLGVTV
jgi:hypothetical protein